MMIGILKLLFFAALYLALFRIILLAMKDPCDDPHQEESQTQETPDLQ